MGRENNSYQGHLWFSPPTKGRVLVDEYDVVKERSEIIKRFGVIFLKSRASIGDSQPRKISKFMLGYMTYQTQGKESRRLWRWLGCMDQLLTVDFKGAAVELGGDYL